MKKASFIFALVWIGLFASMQSAFAQSLDNAIKSYESAAYKEAIEELDKLMEEGKLKEKVLAKAAYYRGASKLAYLQKAKNNLQGMASDLVRAWSLGAYDDFNLAKKNDADQKLSADIGSGYVNLQALLLSLSEDALKFCDAPDATPEKKQVWYQDMLNYAEPSIQIDKFNYRSYVYQGYGHLGLGNEAEAHQSFKLADDWFFRSAPKNGDLDIANIYVLYAELEWKLNKNFDNAMKIIDKGIKQVEGEGRKIQSLGNRPPAEKARYSKLQQDYTKKLEDTRGSIKAQAGK